VINGTSLFTGAGASTASTGEPYLSAVAATMFDAAPVKVDIDSFDSGTGSITVTVEMFSSSTVLDDDILLLVLVEDNITSSHTHVTRDLVQLTFDLTGAGNTYSTTQSFAIDPGWNAANLEAVALVQRAADKAVLQVGSTFPQPDFNIRAMVPSSTISIGSSGGVFETDPFTVVNTGLTDTFTVDVVVDEAPPGWTMAFRDAGGTLHTGPFAFGLTAEEQTSFTAVVTPDSPGYVRYHFEVTSSNITQPLEVPFVHITDDVDALIVDDDSGETFEDYFKAAMDAAGSTYGVWDRSAAALTDAVAQTFDVLVWNAGWAFPTLDADDKAFLASYLDDGKALFLSGQDIGWELNDPNGNPDPVWYQTYLHATYVRDNSGIWDLNGVAGDPVSDGLVLQITGGTGASNQDFPDEIAAADADATEILYYQGDGCGAVRSLDSVSGARIVYLGFGFEGIADAQDREDLLGAALGWIGPKLFDDDFETNDTSAWASVSP
jgi:hypothetical protein